MMDAHSRQLMELEEQEYQRQRQMVARQNQGQLQNTGMPQSRVGAIDSRSQQVSPDAYGSDWRDQMLRDRYLQADSILRRDGMPDKDPSFGSFAGATFLPMLATAINPLLGAAAFLTGGASMAYSLQKKKTKAEPYERAMARYNLANDYFETAEDAEESAYGGQSQTSLIQNHQYWLNNIATPEEKALPQDRQWQRFMSSGATGGTSANVKKTWNNPETGTVWGMRLNGETFDTGEQAFATTDELVVGTDGIPYVKKVNEFGGETKELLAGADPARYAMWQQQEKEAGRRKDRQVENEKEAALFGQWDAESWRKIKTSMPLIQSDLSNAQSLYENIDNGWYADTGMLEGEIQANRKRDIAMLRTMSTAQLLKNLGTLPVPLTPMSDPDIRMVQTLWASVRNDPEANKGVLLAVMALQRDALDSARQLDEHYKNGGNTRNFNYKMPELNTIDYMRKYLNDDEFRRAEGLLLKKGYNPETGWYPVQDETPESGTRDNPESLD